MTIRLAVLIVWSIIIYGAIIYQFVNSYQRVKQYPQSRFNLIPNTSLPVELSDLVRQGQEAGYQYLGTYSMTMPPIFKQTPPESYVFQNDQHTPKLMLGYVRGRKNASFQTIFEDGALLVTTSGTSSSPLTGTIPTRSIPFPT